MNWMNPLAWIPKQQGPVSHTNCLLQLLLNGNNVEVNKQKFIDQKTETQEGSPDVKAKKERSTTVMFESNGLDVSRSIEDNSD